MGLLAPVGSADSQTSLSVLPFFFLLFPMALGFNNQKTKIFTLWCGVNIVRLIVERRKQ